MDPDAQPPNEMSHQDSANISIEGSGRQKTIEERVASGRKHGEVVLNNAAEERAKPEAGYPAPRRPADR